MRQRVSDERLAELLKCTVEQSLGWAIIADLQDARREIEQLQRGRKHPLPLIKVRDKNNGREHVVGSDTHDALLAEEDGSISYMNLQNGEGTGPESCYEFVTEFDGYWTTIPWSEGD